MATRIRRSPKTARLQLRVSEEADSLIREAAEAADKSVTSFITDSAVNAAQSLLADQHHFVLSEEAWDRFVEALERPAEYKPELAKLLQSPRVLGTAIDEEDEGASREA